MNTDDRRQHIEALSWTLQDAWCSSECLLTEAHAAKAMEMAQAVLDSTDPRVHDALTAALHANADRARILASHADAGWLDEETKTIEDGMAGTVWKPDGTTTHLHRPATRKRRLVTPWEPTP